MLPVASLLQNATLTLSGTPQAVPAAITIDFYELMVTCTGDFNFTSGGTGVAFPLVADTVYRIPVQKSAGIRFDGSGTLTICALGEGKK